MLFILGKLGAALLSPLGLALVGLVLAMILFAWARAAAGQGVLAATFAVLYLSATPAVSRTLSAILETQYPPVAVAELPQADVIIVLGGVTSPAYAPRPAPELSQAADRLMHAADIYKAGKAPRILLSGGEFGDGEASPEAEQMRDVLLRFGVPQADIVLEPGSIDTASNASLTHALMTENGWTNAILVTSATHMPRALATFRRQGLDPVPAATDVVSAGRSPWPWADWLPGADALDDTTRAVKELVGQLYYRLRSWS